MRAARLLAIGTRALPRLSPNGVRALHVRASKASITDAIAREKVLVFSKSHCPFCARVKATLDVLDTKYEAVELDAIDDGGHIQALLFDMTGQRTVPNVFINGKHIGGCDDVLALHTRGELVPKLSEERL
uniref:Glutaredoxin domain-containing protein n=1 Tax=Peronospora matthiolae TaxID=2874970 RepID=A0AAV1UN39_9STRA